MNWNNLEFTDEKFYRDRAHNDRPFTFDDAIVYEDDSYVIIQEYYRFIEDETLYDIDNKVSKLLESKKVIGINPGEFWNDSRELFLHRNFYKMSMAPGPLYDMYLQVKSSIESISVLHPEVYDLNTKPIYQSSYMSRRGTEKRFNFFRMCYEHKDKMFINYWNYHWRWQNVELCYFNEWNGIRFPYFTRKQEEDTKEKRVNGDYYGYNAKLLYDAVSLLQESKFNIVLETFDAGPIITEKSILSFLARRIPVFTSEKINRKSLEKLGFYTFDEIYEGFDVEETLLYNNRGGYVIEPEVSWELNKDYYLQWKEIIKKVNSDWGVEYYKSKQDEIQHNFELCKKIDNNTLYKSIGELFDEE